MKAPTNMAGASRVTGEAATSPDVPIGMTWDPSGKFPDPRRPDPALVDAGKLERGLGYGAHITPFQIAE